MLPSDRPPTAETIAVWDCGKLIIEVYEVPGDEHDDTRYYRHSEWQITKGTYSTHDLDLGTDPTRFIFETDRQWRRAYQPEALPSPIQMELIS